jgi:hypothetical protein
MGGRKRSREGNFFCRHGQTSWLKIGIYTYIKRERRRRKTPEEIKIKTGKALYKP